MTKRDGHTQIVALTQELQEAEEFAGELAIMHVLLSGSTARFTGHTQTFCLLRPLKCIQVQYTEHQ